jgi:SAM-dependent methyltransferase
MIGRARERGSAEEFDRDWLHALADRDLRWLAFPDPTRGDQASLAEWVKGQQLLALLRAHGLRGGRVLEYGCGSAGMSIFLRQRGYAATGADLSAHGLEIARMNDQRHRRGAVPLPLVQADTLVLPMRDATFDVVMSHGLLEHFEPGALRHLIREVVRVLRPGGLFVADIVPKRLNARAVGNAANLAASVLYHLLTGRFRRVGELPRAYFGHYYETAFSTAEWETILREEGLTGVAVQGCRPFPPLAVGGRLERLYVRLMRSALPFWTRFDASRAGWTQSWGWMYLAWGSKAAR